MNIDINKKDSMAQEYKIHIAYIDAGGSVVPAGIYKEGEFDLAEARFKSLVTGIEAKLELTITKDVQMTTQFFNNDSTELQPIIMEPEVKTIKPVFLKINSAEETILTALKYVSSKTSKKVVELRAVKPFTSYADLNERVPLSFKKTWEDVAAIDFEQVVGHNTDNAIAYSEGYHPLN